MKQKNFNILIWLIVFALLVSFVSPVLAQANNPTTSVEVQKGNSIPWFVPVLLFIAVAVGATLINNRIARETKKRFNPSSCVPLVEENSSTKKTAEKK